MHTLTIATSWIARHVLAVIVTIAALCLLWTVTYGALVLWAILTDAPLGGPLAYPGGLIAVAAIGCIAAAALLGPATTVAEIIAHRLALPFYMQIPIAIALLAVFCIPLAVGIRGLNIGSAGSAATVRLAAWLFAVSLVPLGIYWWVAQGSALVISRVRFLLRRSLSRYDSHAG